MLLRIFWPKKNTHNWAFLSVGLDIFGLNIEREQLEAELTCDQAGFHAELSHDSSNLKSLENIW